MQNNCIVIIYYGSVDFLKVQKDKSLIFIILSMLLILFYIVMSLTLDEIFNYLRTADKPCLIAVDEFQQITQYPDAAKVEAALRTHAACGPVDHEEIIILSDLIKMST